MPFSDNQKNRLLINLRLPAIIFLIWAALPAQLYLHLYYLVHTVVLIALLPLTVYVGLALREQGKRGLFILAIANSVAILMIIALMSHLDERLMRATL